jgi:hypothetical protein
MYYFLKISAAFQSGRKIISYRNFYKTLHYYFVLKKGNAIPVTGRGGPLGCETSRFPHFVDNQLTDDCEVVSLMCWLLFTSRKIPGTHFC